MIPSDIDSYYRLHSKFYDATRWAFLFGRNSFGKHFPELPEHARILDLGCGTGKHLAQLLAYYPDANIIGIDLSKEMLRFVNRVIVDSVEIRNQHYTLDIFHEDEFDLILCSYSLTMMEDIEHVLEVIQKHLNKNGKLLVVDFDSTPFSWFSKWMKKNHVSFEPDLFELLDESFDVEHKITKKGWFGLYSYSVFLGENFSTL